MVDVPVFDKMLFGAEPDAECQDDECLQLLRQKVEITKQVCRYECNCRFVATTSVRCHEDRQQKRQRRMLGDYWTYKNSLIETGPDIDDTYMPLRWDSS